MKKELFLVVGVLGVLSLSACDARDEKQINAAIKDKSDAEIVQMVVDANKEETLTDVYSDGLKLDGEFKMKGDLAALESSSGFGSVTASGSLDISGDISGVYNASGVQASANVKAKINMKTVVTEGVTTETKIDLKGSATAESLNDEADAYLYAKISGTAASTKLDQEYKYKFKKDSSNSGIGDIISDIDLSKIADENATEESLIKYFSQFNLELKLDLTGMEIEAVYSDGTTEKVDAKDCKAELADPFNYGEVIKALIESEKNMPDFTEDMTEDEFKKIVTELSSKLYGMIYREYTVNVSYQDAQTSYKINFKNIWPDVPQLDERYEVVSVKTPEKVNYTKADTDFFYEADMPYDGSPESKEYYDETYFYPEFKGLEVTVKDKITGKTYTKTFDGTEEDMVYISSVDARPDVTMTNLEVYVMGDVNEWLNLPEDEEYSTEVTGTFKVNYYANGVPSKDIPSTKDTATKDTVTKSATGGNGAVQTGNPITAVSVAHVMLVASGAMFVCYRRKIEK